MARRVACWPRRASTENETQPPEVSADMSRKPVPVLPSPGNSFESTISTSRKSEKSAASVHDADYYQSLRYRNIYIECEEPPADLMQRAQRIISRSRASSEMDDATIQKLKDKSRKLRNEAEDVIIKRLAPHTIPTMDKIPDQRLRNECRSTVVQFCPYPARCIHPDKPTSLTSTEAGPCFWIFPDGLQPQPTWNN